MTKEDCNIILGKMNAMEIELAKNTKLLMGISESSEETKHLQIVQKTEMKGLDEEIKSLKKSNTAEYGMLYLLSLNFLLSL